MLAVFIDYLAEHGLELRNLVIVGHSLGAHISGYAGKNIKSGRIGAIIGLDPAGPLFSIDKPQKRLADNDADYVQIIHTDAGNLSVEHPIGHADFYPNGGNEQPGCSKGNALTNYLSELLIGVQPRPKPVMLIIISGFVFFLQKNARIQSPMHFFWRACSWALNFQLSSVCLTRK